MRVEFKRLAMRIENNNEPAEAKDTLRRLVQSSLDRDISADDADLLCETFRGIEPMVMQEVRSGRIVTVLTLRSLLLGSIASAPCFPMRWGRTIHP